MTIKVNIGTGPISLIVGDNVILEPLVRVSIAAMNVMNNTGSTILLKMYISPDLTSTNIYSKQVFESDIQINGDADVLSIIFQGYNVGQNIIAVPDAVGLELSTTYHEYTNNDA